MEVSLKPSLVEWKLVGLEHARLYLRPLKPSLVEWKLGYAVGYNDNHQSLKPSLVEWKHVGLISPGFTRRPP